MGMAETKAASEAAARRFLMQTILDEGLALGAKQMSGRVEKKIGLVSKLGRVSR